MALEGCTSDSERKNRECLVSAQMRSRKEVRIWLYVSFLWGVTLLPACMGGRFALPPSASTLPIENATPTASTVAEYTFNIGDEVEVKLYYHPELNETTRVRSDGKISLQLVGDIVAQGTTPALLSQQLHEQYVHAGLRNPLVTVMLRKSAGQKVFVGGEVVSPKMIPYEGRLSLSQALFEAGGLKPTAQQKDIILLRDDTQGKPLVMTVSLDQIFEQQRDVALHPYDVVFVPKSTIARVNEFVEQYIVKVLPLSMNAGFQYLLGAAAIP